MGGMPLDPRNPTSKLMLTILAGVATWEREIMLERQREGIAKAKGEGKFKGRKRKPELMPEKLRAAETVAGRAQPVGELPLLAKSQPPPMLSAAIEVGRLFPGVTDNAKARECARTIAGWKPPASAFPTVTISPTSITLCRASASKSAPHRHAVGPVEHGYAGGLFVCAAARRSFVRRRATALSNIVTAWLWPARL
jgi:Resolvase, N terminal domain